MGRPKATINLTISTVEEALANGRVTLSMLATAAGVSVPTMRKHLAETFGDRITFTRGRTGGLALSAVSPESKRAAEVAATPVVDTIAG